MKTVVIGGAGKVGQGVVAAFKKHGWKVKVIDPQVNKTFEELSEQERRRFFSTAEHVVYTTDCGNRETYAENPNLGKENDRRFANFCKKSARLNKEIAIWYIGGSWTKRLSKGPKWLVNDNSPNKLLSECNPYEKAKISAEKNALKLSKLIRIRFLDWVSIVPNLAKNFSICRMTVQALKEEKIKYSPGPYGRSLLERVQAGEALITLIKNDDENVSFKKILIPGVFIPFSVFAKTVKKVVEEKTDKKVELEKMPKTPDFLRTKTRSQYLEKLSFIPNEQLVLKALEENAKEYFKRVKNRTT